MSRKVGPHGEPTAHPKGKINVLVLEDEADVRKVWVETLQEAGYSVVGTASGSETLVRLLDLTPDLILLDMILPDMDGFEFLVHLRVKSSWALIPVLVVSAIGVDMLGASDLRAREMLGIAGILQKPVDVHTLVGQVRQIIGRAQPPTY